MENLNSVSTKPAAAQALGPKGQAGTATNAIPPAAKQATGDEAETPKTSFGEIWCRERLRLYVRSYTLIRGKSLKREYPQSLKEAMS